MDGSASPNDLVLDRDGRLRKIAHAIGRRPAVLAEAVGRRPEQGKWFRRPIRSAGLANFRSTALYVGGGEGHGGAAPCSQ